MELSRISSGPYRARVRRLSKSQLVSVHRVNSVRSRSIRIAQVSHTSSARQQLSKSNSQSPQHATIIDSELASNITLSRISSTPWRSRTKRIDRSNIQSVHDNKSLQLHTTSLKKISRIQSIPYCHHVIPLGQRGLLSADQSWSFHAPNTQVSLFTDMPSV